MKIYLEKILILLALVGTINFAAFAQAKARPHKDDCPEEQSKLKEAENFVEPQTEKAVAADVKPTVEFCVSEGSVRVRGWQRNEIRAFSEHGKLGIKILKQNSDDAASWIKLIGSDPKNHAAGKREDCLSGVDIEIEVPFGTYLNIKNRDGDLQIESVAKARIQSVNGDILLRDVREETEVSNLQGDIVAEDSTGRFVLKSSVGSILANRLKPVNASDALIAAINGSGNVTFQNVVHANIEARTVSGELNVFGALSSGGNYDFKTTTGAVTLYLPSQSSFQFNATLGANGVFGSNLPIKTSSSSSSPGRPRNISGTYGKGDATINLTTFNGALRFEKQ